MKKKAIHGYMMLAPLMILLIGVFGAGVLESVLQSLGYFPALGKTEITFDYYIQVFKDPYFIESFFYTLFFSAVSSILAVVVGIAIAYYMIQMKKGEQLTERISRIPVYMPHLIVVVIMILCFSQTGILARITYMLGWIVEPKDFPVLIHDKKGIGIILVYMWKGIPFVIMAVLIILRNINQSFVVVAKNLGASTGAIFWKIQLPLILPSMLSSLIILFAFAFGGFEVPYLIGGTIPEALPVRAYMAYTSSSVDQRIYAMVLNVIMISISLILLGVYRKISNQIKKYR
ncbi:MAG: ABC transporter permease [Cellulosilyticaceae bacterium]